MRISPSSSASARFLIDVASFASNLYWNHSHFASNHSHSLLTANSNHIIYGSEIRINWKECLRGWAYGWWWSIFWSRFAHLCRSRSCTADLKFIPSDSWGLGESKQQTLLGEQFDLLNRKGGVEGQNAVKISGSTLSPQIIDTTPGRLKIQKETQIQKKYKRDWKYKKKLKRELKYKKKQKYRKSRN